MTKRCEHGLTYAEQCTRCRIVWHKFMLNIHEQSAKREREALAKWEAKLCESQD